VKNSDTSDDDVGRPTGEKETDTRRKWANAMRFALPIGAAIAYAAGGFRASPWLGALLAGYGAVFVVSFVRGCQGDCPERGLRAAADTIFAVILVVSTGGIGGPFVVLGALVVGLNGVRLDGVSAALYGGAAGLAVLGFHAASGGGEWPGAIGATAAFPAFASVVSYLGRYGREAAVDWPALRDELREDSRRLELQRARIGRLLTRLRGVRNLADVGRTSAEIIHQVRDPLSAISLNLEMLEEDLEEEGLASEEVRTSLARIEQEVAALADLAENYLQYARLPAPECRIEDADEIVESVLAQEQPRLARSHVAVQRERADGPARVNVDRRQVRFVLRNLIENAREAMSEGGRLKISTVSDNGSVAIRVSDTGPGITAEDRRRIFDAFYTTKRRGTGLGLSIARKIVQQHGGRLVCRSLPDVGATFEMIFDAAEMKDGD